VAIKLVGGGGDPPHENDTPDHGGPFVEDGDPGPSIEAGAPIDLVISQMNHRYMVVNEDGRALIYEPVMHRALGRKYYRRISFADFRNLYLNTSVRIGTTERGKAIIATHGEAWLNSPNRKQFLDGVVFDPSGSHKNPNELNLWQGFGVDPLQGSWQRLKDHALEIICAGNTDHFDWLMSWMARMVQKPAEQGEIAVVMRSIQGTGKGTLAKALCKLLGQHSLLISNAKHLTGNFNAHLQDTVFLFADEAFFAGDPQHVGVLKSMITDDMLLIEGKFKNAVQSKNYVHLMMASNADWVIPAELEDRRFAMFEVLTNKLRDFEYFNKIDQELYAGGYQAMLYDLQKWDISEFNHRLAPQTEALQQQKKRSLPFEVSWWMNCLHRGWVHKSTCGMADYFERWHVTISRQLAHAAYETAASKAHQRRPLSPEDFGRFMTKMGAMGGRGRGVITGEQITDVETGLGGTVRRGQLIKAENAAYTYTPGDIREARQKFQDATGLRVDWGDQDPLLL
jgi:hypothetical protein